MAVTRPRLRRQNFFGSMILPYLIAIVSIGILIYFTGLWRFTAYTRLLNLAIRSGIVRYHDNAAGLIHGVPDKQDYIYTTTPVDWPLLIGVLALFISYWLIRAVELREIVRHYGYDTKFGQNVRSYTRALYYKMALPFHYGETAQEMQLQAEGVPVPAARNSVFLLNVVIIFEIVVFALLGLFTVSARNWIVQIFWFGMILLFAYLWTHHEEKAWHFGRTRLYFRTAWAHYSALFRRPVPFLKISLLGLLAFALEDFGAYFAALALGIHIELKPIIMGVIGSYIARFIQLTPGGVGQYEWGFAAGLYVGGVGLPEAGTIAIIDNFIRYVAYFVIYWIELWRSGRSRIRFRQVEAYALGDTKVMKDIKPIDADDMAVATTDSLYRKVEVPEPPLLDIPRNTLLWRRALTPVWLLLALFAWDRFTSIMADYWLFQSVNLTKYFDINFHMRVYLFLAGFVLFVAGFVIPPYIYKLSRTAKKYFIQLGVIMGLIGGYLMQQHFLNVLLTFGKFGKVDPYFHKDYGFYMFTLPSIWVFYWLLWFVFLFSLVAGCVAAYLANTRTDAEAKTLWLRVKALLGKISTKWTLTLLALFDILNAVGIWLTRYNLLNKDNEAHSIFNGVSYIDVNGVFSTLNAIYLSAFVSLIDVIGLVVLLASFGINRDWRYNKYFTTKRVLLATLGLALADLAFVGCVAVRDAVAVAPNEPVIQRQYIERNIEATREGYNLNQIQEIPFTPAGGDDPLPTASEVLSNPSFQNAPLWPTYSNYLERLLDPEYTQRLSQTAGDPLVYGTTLQTFQQQQNLRAYYEFMSIFALRFNVNGNETMYAASARELPLLEPQPWLIYWGQRFVLYTHGYGEAATPTSGVTGDGSPAYASSGIPATTDVPQLQATNQRIYYGDGAASMAFSNVKGIQELDYPTEQSRALTNVAAQSDINNGIPMDSLLKRIVMGWRSGRFFEITFSNIITPKTRVMYLRTPLDRMQRLAPFLYFDTNDYMLPVNGDLTWEINGMTYTNKYPDSKIEELGDKAFERDHTPRPNVWADYIENSVTVTLDATNGQPNLYIKKHDPIVDVWSGIYPGLFKEKSQMPAAVAEQMQYPVQLYHIQFDDIYNWFHQQDPYYFFNQEDNWDDGDEVIGPVLDSGKAIQFSIEPYQLVVPTGAANNSPLPASTDGKPTQFVLSMPFTPASQKNLRAITYTYQDGSDLGKQITLEIPKGDYVLGPDQADAAIDQDPTIAQQFTLWKGQGMQLIRGQTTLLLVGNEVVYLEPEFIRSEQIPVPELKGVSIVVRGKAYMGKNLEDAVNQAFPASPEQGGPPASVVEAGGGPPAGAGQGQ